MMLWFLERAFGRVSTNLRAKDKDAIEASAPSYITPEVIKWEEMKRNTAGPSSFLRSRAAAEDREVEVRSVSSSKPRARSTATSKSVSTSVEEQPLMKLNWQQKIELLQTEFDVETNHLLLTLQRTRASVQEKHESSREMK